MLVVIGGAISQAKGAFSNWWSNLLVSPEPVQKAVEAITENGASDTECNAATEKIESEPTETHKAGEIHTV